jgi:FKBP-type peptidyl-prolyl cis-trans isomerase (trigger factor)
MRNGTMKPEDMASQQEEIMAESRKAAAIRVRAQFVLSRIAEENKLDLNREELGMAVMRAAQTTQTPPEKLVKDRQRLGEIRRDALLNKALDLVLAASNEAGVEKK